MEPINRHPLEAITCRSSLSMLEALIPFVDYSLKLPLALFIKLDEIRLIIDAFQSRRTLCKLGLHNTNSDLMDILCSLTGMSPDLLKMMMSMMENMGDSFSTDMLSGLMGNSAMDFSNLASMFGQSTKMNEGTPSNHSYANNHQTDDNDFDRNIEQILAEYDLKAAEQMQNETDDLSTNFAPNNF